MSAEPKTAFEAALQAHIADQFNSNAALSGYVTKAHFIDLGDDDTTVSEYLFLHPENQAYHETYGLLLTAQDDFVTASLEHD